jgi:hypothetical protein
VSCGTPFDFFAKADRDAAAGRKGLFACSVGLQTFLRLGGANFQTFRLFGRLQQTTLRDSPMDAPTPKCQNLKVTGLWPAASEIGYDCLPHFRQL